MSGRSLLTHSLNRSLLLLLLLPPLLLLLVPIGYCCSCGGRRRRRAAAAGVLLPLLPPPPLLLLPLLLPPLLVLVLLPPPPPPLLPLLLTVWPVGVAVFPQLILHHRRDVLRRALPAVLLCLYLTDTTLNARARAHGFTTSRPHDYTHARTYARTYARTNTHTHTQTHRLGTSRHFSSHIPNAPKRPLTDATPTTCPRT